MDGFFFGAANWWDLPSGVHAIALTGLAAIFFLATRRILAGLFLPAGKWQWTLAVVLVLLGVFLCLNQFGELKNVDSRTTDFGTICKGSAALFNGGDPYSATANGYFYPPLLAFLFGPLLWAPLTGASTWFFSIKFIMIFWTLFACDQLVAGNRFSGERRTLFLTGLVFVASRFWTADLQFGNTNVLILFLVVAAIYFDREDRPTAAGLALALAVSIKLIPAVLCLPFLITRRWRTLVFFLVGLVGFNVLPWFVVRDTWWSSWVAYFDAGVTGKLGERLAQPDNQSLWGLINRLFPKVALSTLRWVWMALSGALAAFACSVVSQARSRGALEQIAALSLFPLLGLLVSPGSWVVHYTAILLPMVVLLTVALAGLGSNRWFFWVLFFCTNFAFTLSGWSRPTVSASISQSWFVTAAVLLMLGLGTWVLSPATSIREGSPGSRP